MFTELPPLTLVHVIISLIAIASGFVVLVGLINGKMLESWTATFLFFTVLTSVSGFFLPAAHLMPSHIVGILSLVVLAAAIVARYLYHLRGAWRATYVVSAMVALYLNVFVLGVQLFAKVPLLKALAPTQSEPPFVIAQVTVLALFVVLTIVANRGSRSFSLALSPR